MKESDDSGQKREEPLRQEGQPDGQKREEPDGQKREEPEASPSPAASEE